jgi:hypothetical protein
VTTSLPVSNVVRIGKSLRASFLAVLVLSAGCNRAAIPADPAIWRVSGKHGEEAWLFGTIHAAPQPLAWRSTKVDAALSRSSEVMVEVANIADDQAISRSFAALSRTPGLPPVEQRVAPQKHRALARMMADRGVDGDDLRDVETWAIALTLARPASVGDAANGIDRAVLAATSGKRVIELEGATGQLAIFDRLPETEQRDLLGYVIADAGVLDDEADLVDTWRRGDMDRIEAETQSGLLADRDLREALFTARNRSWRERIVREIRAGRRPFVAVGAAHMAGPDGLVAMLQHAGYTVERLR